VSTSEGLAAEPPTADTMTAFAHTPVLLREVLEVAALVPARLIVDCTVGGGGHARALLEQKPGARLLAVDRDPAALAAAAVSLASFGDRVRLVHARFSELEVVLSDTSAGAPDLILVDLGVSSHQLDAGERGFSFRADGPLDMRMDPTAGESAAELIAGMGEGELADAIYQLGEERHSRRVARAIVAARPTTTGQLAAVVRRVVPKSKDGIDPATRTFQALRMLVNRELDELGTWLAAVPRVLAPGGVALAISFHSLEDRAVKNAFREAARDCVCPSELPACVCGGHRATLEVLTSKPLVAATDEAAANPRARSAKLRAARRLVVTA
jgi:16S rRNA (cytosine1402-N4)-methyltransferase